MALECGDDLRGGFVVEMRDIRRVAEASSCSAGRSTWAPRSSGESVRPCADRRRLDPADRCRRRQGAPREISRPDPSCASGATSECASTRSRRNAVAREDVAAERDHGVDLRVGEIAVAEFVPGIDDLDADRARIDVGHALPRRHAGMPGAPRFRHELIDAAVLVDEVVRGDFRAPGRSAARALPRRSSCRCSAAGECRSRAVRASWFGEATTRAGANPGEVGLAIHVMDRSARRD